MTSSLAQPTTQDQLVETWKTRIRQARDYRRQFEPTWLSNLAFAAGQHWLVYDPRHRRMRHISEVDPRYDGRELYTADRITEYRDAQLGELTSDDERPQLLATQDGPQAEDATHVVNRLVGYGWDFEWDADEAVRTASRYCLDLGYSALRCRWNPNVGPTVGHVPLHGDDPVTDPSVIQHLTANGVMPDGSLPRFKPVKEGRTDWCAYSAFMTLTPPGVNHEKDFPWEILVRPVLIDDLIGEYGSKAAGLSEDGDIASAMGLSTQDAAATGQQQSAGRLRDHVWLYTCFQRPNRHNPDGQVVVIASNSYRLLDVQETLPYRLPNGEPHSGIVYLHWRRRSDRFQSGSFIENLKDPQRMINRRETQNVEIIDRGMPASYLEDGAMVEEPTGVPAEIRYLKKGTNPPQFFQGFGPGAWMYEDLTHHADNLSHASTLSQLRLGENPPNVNTYSQLALLNENEAVKRSLMLVERRAAIGTLTILALTDVIRYWPDEKKILIPGDNDQVQSQLFRKATMPTFFMLKPATGAAQPRSQAAELKKIDAVWAAAVQSGLAIQQAAEWTAWYSDSIEAGSPLPLPQPDQDSQQRMAQLENVLMQQGQQPVVMDYDLLGSHLPEHRAAQDEARAAGDQQWLARLDQHVADHVAQQQRNAELVAQARQVPGPDGQTVAPDQQGGAPQPQFAQPDFLRLAAGN